MLRKYLFTGLLIWIPLGITIWVIQLIIGTMDQIGSILPSAVRPDYWLLQHLAVYVPWLQDKQHIPGFGLVFALSVLLLTGVIARNMLGRRLLLIGEQLLNRIPIVRSIYSSVKQVSDTLFSDSGQAFRKAALVQFPHQGTWSIGFITGSPRGEISAKLSDDLVSVFVPTTPNPTSGFLFMARKADVRELDMSVDEALKYVISMGVVTPGGNAPASAQIILPVSTTETGEPARAEHV
ncbi:hypothetical protein IGB42_01303 [Andreprevotia sp. IGB-42]|uniref:DUF502 domain-containing protein n=1 Tax=Andreprevotia sp. IGB-42 TaxID=2497473 RepID=UPI00157F4DFA|nr:DUF502 domain-containing protein [Andreprevotia sp. IGB-42]KAF0814402.1 hypothetical protein IGB42_01303 [Andreprevotia sp. IGB-42]